MFIFKYNISTVLNLTKNFIIHYRNPERIFTSLGGVDSRQYRFALSMDPSTSSNKAISIKTSFGK